MDPSLPPPSLSAAVNYPDSVNSSPRSRNNDTNWDDSLSSLPPKLRLMCSYGGHIVPRPHDKSLCYVGGDTRIIVSDRTTSLPDLSARLSKTLLDGRAFTLKYQLPNEDLDSLISVTTNEDLENMIEEYDRTATSLSKPSRLRIFLFPAKPDSSQSIGPLLEGSAKSEDWFLNVLNGAGILNRGYSDPFSVNCLLGLDVDGAPINSNPTGHDNKSDVGVKNVEGSIQPNCNTNVKQQWQDVQSIPDSPMMETTTSFGSSSSSPSLGNLPPIRVHAGEDGVRVQDQKVGIEQQFGQMGYGGVVGQKQEEGFIVLSSPPKLPTTMVAAGPVSSAAAVNEFLERDFLDDERLDHCLPPQSLPQTLPPQLPQQKSSGGLELPSPSDSVSSESSVTNPLSIAKPAVIYQEPIVQIPTGTTSIMPGNHVDQNISMADPSTRIHVQQQVQDSGYMLQSQFEQQSFLHAGTRYIQQPPPGPMQIPGYYPVYPSQQHHPHPQLDPQYPMYYMPARPAQTYNMSTQHPNINEAPTPVSTIRQQSAPNPAIVSLPPSYNPMRSVPIAKPDMASCVYGAVATPQYVQVPSSQHQQQYVGFSQIRHPSQSVTHSPAATPNYAYELSDAAHAQIYYTQPLAPTLPSHYETMMATNAIGLPDTSPQLSGE